MQPGSVAPANPNAGTHRVTALGPRRSTSISRLTPNTRYAYSVWAEDASGNLSARRTGIVLTARR
jgi:chitodextrinase